MRAKYSTGQTLLAEIVVTPDSWSTSHQNFSPGDQLIVIIERDS